MKKSRPLSLLAMLGGLWLVPVHASVITYSIDCSISGTGCAAITPIGTLTLTDNTSGADNRVDVAVNLTSGVFNIQGIYLNYIDANFSNASAFSVTAGTGTVAVDENDQKADGLPSGTYGEFDLLIEPPSSTGEPYSTTLALAGFDIFVSDFDLTSNGAGTLFAALKTTAGGTWNGASSRVTTTPPTGGNGTVPTAQVPEPAVWSLLLAGLLGLQRARRPRAVR